MIQECQHHFEVPQAGCADQRRPPVLVGSIDVNVCSVQELPYHAEVALGAGSIGLNIPLNLLKNSLNVQWKWVSVWTCLKKYCMSRQNIHPKTSPQVKVICYWIASLCRCFEQRRHPILGDRVDVYVGSAKEHLNQLWVLLKRRDDERRPSWGPIQHKKNITWVLA